MSIDARVSNVVRIDGEYRLVLEDRDAQSSAGQSVLIIENSKDQKLEDVSLLVGCEIWGNAVQLMIGDTKFADRLGYTGISLMPQWAETVASHKAKVTKKIPR